MDVETVGSPVWWAGFLALVLFLLGLDLGVLRRKSAEMSMRAAAGWTVAWVSIAAAFAAFVWQVVGDEPAKMFVSGYIVEMALSVDNVFVFGVLFTFFGVPRSTQQRVLFWGILGALIMRAIFIGLGAAVIHAFSWSLYVFGAILIYTGIKLLFHDDDEIHPDQALLVRVARRLIPVTDGYRGEAFLVHEQGRWIATPLLIVLIAVEGSDLLFAVDSIPAVFGVTSDPFIVYTSNIFAILGLRSLYFLVAGLMAAFHYLKVGLSVILSFIGVKMLVHSYYVVPTEYSLGVIVGVLLITILASIVRTRMLAGAEAKGD